MNYSGSFRGHLKPVTPHLKQQHKFKKEEQQQLANPQTIKYQLTFPHIYSGSFDADEWFLVFVTAESCSVVTGFNITA